MIDEFAGNRLPDLPNDGYATKREKAISDEMMQFIRSAERDRLYLLSIVCDGKAKFRRIIKKEWRHLKATDETADAIFGYLVLLAGNDPERQRDALLTMPSPFQSVLSSPHR